MYEINKQSGSEADFDKARFVIRARSDDETRPFLCVLHVERAKTGTRLVATDGRRLHVAQIKQRIDPGEYEVVETKQSIILRGPLPDLQFPNWKRVVPEASEERTVIDLSTSGICKNPAKTANFSIEYARLVKETGEVLNIKFIEDLPKAEWHVYAQNEKNRSVMLKNGLEGDEVFAVIMPLNIAA